MELRIAKLKYPLKIGETLHPAGTRCVVIPGGHPRLPLKMQGKPDSYIVALVFAGMKEAILHHKDNITHTDCVISEEALEHWCGHVRKSLDFVQILNEELDMRDGTV